VVTLQQNVCWTWKHAFHEMLCVRISTALTFDLVFQLPKFSAVCHCPCSSNRGS